jgi:hypothetical protein
MVALTGTIDPFRATRPGTAVAKQPCLFPLRSRGFVTLFAAYRCSDDEGGPSWSLTAHDGDETFSASR